MASFIVLLLFCVKHSIGFSLMDEFEGPIWPEDYHMKAEKINMAAGILENMELWSSSSTNRSRMDFYDGLVKKYYYWEEENESGYVYSFMPRSTEDYQNKITCALTYLEHDEMVYCLPNEDDFKHTGKQELEGKTVDVWKYEKVFAEKRWMERTLYTYRVHDYDVPVRKYLDLAQDVTAMWDVDSTTIVPIVVSAKGLIAKSLDQHLKTLARYESKNYLIANGATTHHTIWNYYSFEPTAEEEELEEGDTDDCGYMSTLGADFPTDIKHLHPATDVDSAFHSYKKHHGKEYSGNEHELRKAIFHETWEMVEHHNRQNLGYKMELNQFADRASDEMSEFTGLRPSPPMVGTHPFPHSDEELKTLAEELPESYDMRMEGIISAVKNQAQCGSCWAFASTAAVEGALARSNGGRIVDLSEQSLVDCAWGSGCAGCDGGIMELAYHYIMKHGIPMEEEYGSYLEQDGLCHTDNMTSSYHIKGFAKITPYNPQALKVALYKYGPVSVSINFSKKMRYYASGIFYDPDCNKDHTNHGVVVVGYGVRDGADYWIIRNSHGSGWGQAGYILISAANNNCFVLQNPIYPIV